jgi:hypothetical protein
MSHFFGDVSDEDVDSSVHEDSDNESSSSEELEGFAKWAARDTTEKHDDEGAATRGAQSNEAKMFRAVCDACDRIEFVDFDEPDSWQQALGFFKEASEHVEKYYAKFHKLPDTYAHMINSLTNEIDERKDSGAEDNKTRKFFNQFQKSVGAEREKYQQQIAQLGTEVEPEEGEGDEDEGPADDKELTEEKIKEFLRAGVIDTRKCRTVLRKIRDMKGGQEKISLQIAAYAHLSTCILRSAPSTGATSGVWRKACQALKASVDLALANPSIHVSEAGQDFTDKVTIVKNGFSSAAVELHDGLVKACQNEDYFPKANRVQDEALVASLLDQLFQYYSARKMKRNIARVAVALLEIMHVRNNHAHELLTKGVPFLGLLAQPADVVVDTLAAAVDDLSSDPTTKTMATLAHVYHVAVRDQYHRARDLFFSANVQLDPTSDNQDALVRYNRVIAQIGLCAFRTGLFNESHTVLSELCAKNPKELRDLLGQTDLLRAARRYGDEDEEKIARDRLRLVPPHHAMPAELIEQGHLVLSMANDIIVEAKNPDERPQRSKQFFNLCKRHQNAVLSGPPVSDANRIYAAYLALQDGDIETALRNVKALAGWKYLPPKSNALALLEQKLRVDGLKVFLISRGQHYASLTVNAVCQRFGLSEEEVKTTVSRLILDHTLVGHWDHDDTHVVIERGPQSRFHLLARDCCDKVSQFAAYNEAPGATNTGRDGRGGRGGNLWGVAGRGRGRGRGAQ